MNISYNWLKEYVDFDMSAQEVADALTSIGLEVGSVEEVQTIKGGLAGLVVGEVLTCEPHPNSDHLHVCSVAVGEDAPLQIVCGAPNVDAGQKVIVATLGTKLYTKIRGIESFGMICAEDEIGVGTDHAGIIVLPNETPVGLSAKDYYQVKDDYLIEVDITPNRADACSHYGVARDFYAWLVRNGHPTQLHKKDVSGFKVDNNDLDIEISVENPEACPRYCAVTLKDCEVKESPQWLQDKLRTIGLRPINNIVDITNYIMFAYGQPLHCFDADMIKGRKVIVKTMPEGTEFVTLDGATHRLSEHDLAICNVEEPMCIAGVFGGKGSGTYETTRNVLLESAYFNPVSIRKSAKRHSLSTDASFRYERGADPMIAEYAAKRAALLICELAGGHVVGRMQEFCPEKIEKKQIDLDYARIESFIGKKIGAEAIETILSALAYEFVERYRDAEGRVTGAKVAAPSYMIDVYRECDVVEEILRIYGYNNIELPKGVRMSVNATQKPEPEVLRNIVSDFLADNGFNETMNNSLTKSEYYSKLTTFPEARCVRILNPLSSDLNVLRQTLLFNGLEVIEHNVNRQIPTLRIFEYGSVYSLKDGADGKALDSYDESTAFSIFITGPGEKSWRTGQEKSDYFQLKGYLELLFRRFGADIYSMETGAAPADLFSEGLVYRLPGSSLQLAVMGTVAPARLRQFGIRQPVFAAEISWPGLFELAKRDKIRYKELPKFPEVRRDLALLLDEKVSYADLRKCAFRTVKKLLKQVTLFDVYRGDRIPSDKKQYALNFVLQDMDRTMTDNDVEKVMARLVNVFSQEFGATLR